MGAITWPACHGDRRQQHCEYMKTASILLVCSYMWFMFWLFLWEAPQKFVWDDISGWTQNAQWPLEVNFNCPCVNFWMHSGSTQFPHWKSLSSQNERMMTNGCPRSRRRQRPRAFTVSSWRRARSRICPWQWWAWRRAGPEYGHPAPGPHCAPAGCGLRPGWRLPLPCRWTGARGRTSC